MDFSEVIKTLTEFISDNGLHIAMCLYILGYIVKGSKRIPDSAIPFILLITGVAGSVAWGNEPSTAECVIQGFYAAGLAIGVNQFQKQGKEFHETMMNDEYLG